ncbi:hypothetical protein H2248_004031 [Termitomyces sp. 'cryptogamus']|nr:hypothetical protein H2248_004031 [Termitomyces sp. 'cryptogamus']
MQLRKCLQHPYLYAEDIEPRGLLPQESHEKLIDGSGKLRFLMTLLPKLKERGHRVLLFSQFVIALDVIEDFLNGEGLKQNAFPRYMPNNFMARMATQKAKIVKKAWMNSTSPDRRSSSIF